ncbi:MAG: hypothetical protein ACE5J7_00930 [Candidatus Aenigmatarchaeota archaeon]
MLYENVHECAKKIVPIVSPIGKKGTFGQTIYATVLPDSSEYSHIFKEAERILYGVEEQLLMMHYTHSSNTLRGRYSRNQVKMEFKNHEILADWYNDFENDGRIWFRTCFPRESSLPDISHCLAGPHYVKFSLEEDYIYSYTRKEYKEYMAILAKKRSKIKPKIKEIFRPIIPMLRGPVGKRGDYFALTVNRESEPYYIGYGYMLGGISISYPGTMGRIGCGKSRSETHWFTVRKEDIDLVEIGEKMGEIYSCTKNVLEEAGI